MAIDLGQLKQYNAEKGIKFEFGSKVYHIQPTMEQGLAFQVAQHERDERGRELEAIMRDADATDAQVKKAREEFRYHNTFSTYDITAPFFGSKFHYPTKSKPARFEGGIIAELLEAGMDYGTVDRLIGTLYLVMVNTEDVAVEYMKSGKLGQAVATVEAREKDAQAALATQKEPGETAGTD